MSSEMNSKIIKKIESGVYRILQKRQSRSKVWDVFSLIEKDDGTVLDGVVICHLCNHIFKYNGKQTSNLVRHKCYVMKNLNVTLKRVSNEDKEDLLVACSQWLVDDCRPFSIVDGEGFKKLVQSLLNIGNKCGNFIDLAEMLPDSRTISQRISAIAEEKRLKMTEELRMAITNGTASITADLWTDNFIKRIFLCATFHFIKDLELKEIVLGVKSMDFQRCTADNVVNKLNSILKDFEVNSMENIIFVTDRESNIVKALKYQKRINCANHLLNNVLDSALSGMDELRSLVESCKNLAKYSKKVSLEPLLSTTINNYSITDWNSHLNIFKLISSNYSKLEEMLSSVNEMQRISHINLSILNVLVDIFEKFNIVSEKLQDVQNVTINYVCLTIDTIKNICVKSDTDIEIIKTLKINILKEMETKYIAHLSIIHYTACFLYPPTNSCLDQSKLEEVKGFCVSEIMKTIPPSENLSNSTMLDEKPKDFQLFFSTLITSANPSISENIYDEINRYSFLKINVDVNFDVLQWWESHTSEFPRLYKFAQKILAIPASSSASEHVFSAAGNVITEKRYRIGPQTVNNILFLNSLCKYE